MKQGLEQCLAEYSTKELIQFHANLIALFSCCTEDFHLFPLIMRVHFYLEQRKEPIAAKYMTAILSTLKTKP